MSHPLPHLVSPVLPSPAHCAAAAGRGVHCEAGRGPPPPHLRLTTLRRSHSGAWAGHPAPPLGPAGARASAAAGARAAGTPAEGGSGWFSSAAKLGFAAENAGWHEGLMLLEVGRQHIRGSGLALIQLGSSAPDIEARSPNSCAHHNHQGTCPKQRFLGPTPTILAQDMAGALGICICDKGPS